LLCIKKCFLLNLDLQIYYKKVFLRRDAQNGCALTTVSTILRRLTTLWNSIENFFLEIYFVENLSLNRKTERNMYGPEIAFEIFNFEWKQVFTFLSENMAKMQLIAQKNVVFGRKSRLDIILHKCGKINCII